MKKSTVCSAFLAALMIMSTSLSYANSDGSVVVPCKEAAWSPEVMTFYGDTAKVAEKLAKVQTQLLERRVYMLLTETSDRTDVALFERKDSENVTLSQWSTTSPVKVGDAINEKLLANAGVSCAGELAKHILKVLSENRESSQIVRAPTTAFAAYKGSLQHPNDSYVRVTLYFFC
jgi:hypothetical protein